MQIFLFLFFIWTVLNKVLIYVYFFISLLIIHAYKQVYERKTLKKGQSNFSRYQSVCGSLPWEELFDKGCWKKLDHNAFTRNRNFLKSYKAILLRLLWYRTTKIAFPLSSSASQHVNHWTQWVRSNIQGLGFRLIISLSCQAMNYDSILSVIWYFNKEHYSNNFVITW